MLASVCDGCEGRGGQRRGFTKPSFVPPEPVRLQGAPWEPRGGSQTTLEADPPAFRFLCCGPLQAMALFGVELFA